MATVINIILAQWLCSSKLLSWKPDGMQTLNNLTMMNELNDIKNCQFFSTKKIFIHEFFPYYFKIQDNKYVWKNPKTYKNCN